MGEVINVNFIKREKINKYTVKKYICANCKQPVYIDSRVEDNPAFLLFETNNGYGLCVACAKRVGEAVKNEGW